MRAHVLVVERDLFTREVIIDLLGVLGHLAFRASSPVRGLKMLDVIWFNAIIISPGATLLDEPSHAIDAKKLQPHVKVIMAAAVDLPEFLELPIDAFI
jgi:hypothetical protein